MKTTRLNGFTLIELMIVVLVVAVLASIALSLYSEQLRKSRRAEAKQVLADYALREEKWRANHTNYTATLSDINGASPLPSGNYSITITFPAAGAFCAGGAAKGSANSFIITAATVAGSKQASDTKCPTLAFVNDCGTTSKLPAGDTCW